VNPNRGAGAGDRTAPAERTQLAWSRTLLAGTVVAVLAFRLALHRGPGGGVAGLTAAAAVAGWLAMFALARMRVRALRRRPPAATRRAPVVLTLVVVGLAVLATALAVLP